MSYQDPITPEAHVAILEVFDNPRPERDYTIVHICPEFTSVCPKTGQPDFATITIEYVAESTCLELKALKLYFQAYRNQGIYYEAVTNRICDDLAGAMKPRWLVVQTDWKGRGGIRSRITASHGKAPA